MQLTEVANGVWQAGTRFVNWYLVDAGSDGLTVVDTGLPGYRSQLRTALHRVGRSAQDVRAVVLTHGHIDHVGSADAFRSTADGGGVPVFLHPADAELAAKPGTNTSDSSVVPYLRWPATWAFLGHCLSQGAAWPAPMPTTVAVVDGQEVDAPGRPHVTHVPGHTDGSCVLEFREHGVAFVGDLLCTVSPRTGRRADPQLQTRGSNKDSTRAYASLERLADLDARLVMPGHGGPWRDGVEAAVASARRIGCR
jgi:glyoxylase-like metal-dependent hydrolase (beta-lactamase superfamily II)